MQRRTIRFRVLFTMMESRSLARYADPCAHVLSLLWDVLRVNAFCGSCLRRETHDDTKVEFVGIIGACPFLPLLSSS